MNNCDMYGHQYQAVGDEHYKRLKEGAGDRNLCIGYTIIFCTQCGETKQIVSRDERPVDDQKPS